MAHMTDIMVDVETTSTTPSDGGIIQIAAIKFNAETGEIGDTFDRCPTLLPRRYWSESTREFWMHYRDIYEGLIARAEPAGKVFADFRDFARSDGLEDGLRFWAKPILFDWPFVESHFEQLGMHMPFAFRYGRDLNTYISALHGTAEHVELADQVPFSGNKHNALHDCAWQIDLLMHAKRKFVTTEIVA